MIKFALADSRYESEKRYEANNAELTVFAKGISKRDLSSDRFQIEQEKIRDITKNQEQLQVTLPELIKTQERFESLAPEEKRALHTRLDDKSGELKLVLQRRNGELLAQAS